MPWYAVRHLIQNDGSFEERITLWDAASFEEAIQRCEAEVAEHTSAVGGTPLDLFQAFWLFEPPTDGSEIFSLIRRSDLSETDYVERFFDTGEEHQE